MLVVPSSLLGMYLQKQTGVDIQSQLEGQGLLFDDLAVEIEDEYNPMIPNSYERVIRDRREEHDRIREAEVYICSMHVTGTGPPSGIVHGS